MATRLLAVTPGAPAQLWYPSAATQRDAAPAAYRGVLVVIPGWGGRRGDLTGLALDLASHGWLVAALDPWSRTAQEPGVAEDLRTPFDVSSDAGFARTTLVANREAPRQAAMVRATLDALTSEFQVGTARTGDAPTGGGTTAAPIGVLGYSFGGAVAVAAARADPRILAVVNLDGWVFGDADAAPFPAPYLLFGADGRDLTVEEPRDEAERRMAFMDRREEPGNQRQFRCWGGHHVILRGADHADFSDEALRQPRRWFTGKGRIDPRRAQAALAVGVRAFLDASLFDAPPAFGPTMLASYPEFRMVASGAPGAACPPGADASSASKMPPTRPAR